MNSRTWLITYLTQNGFKILLLKRFKNFEFCLFRQQSEFLLVGQCPSLAVGFPVPQNCLGCPRKPAHFSPRRCSLLGAGAAKGPRLGKSQTFRSAAGTGAS